MWGARRVADGNHAASHADLVDALRYLLGINCVKEPVLFQFHTSLVLVVPKDSRMYSFIVFLQRSTVGWNCESHKQPHLAAVSSFIFSYHH